MSYFIALFPNVSYVQFSSIVSFKKEVLRGNIKFHYKIL
jgi:hypothetical protein